jgi:single-stranded-DNA-specific exonuclease
MAAGLTVAADKIDALGDFLEARLAEDVARASESRSLLIDAILAPGGVTPALAEALEAGGPYGMGWPAPRIAAGPLRIVKADVVGKDHVRAIMAGDDGRSFKTVAFRQAETVLGQALLHSSRDRRLWVAGRVKVDDWSGRSTAELHIDDAAWCD